MIEKYKIDQVGEIQRRINIVLNKMLPLNNTSNQSLIIGMRNLISEAIYEYELTK